MCPLRLQGDLRLHNEQLSLHFYKMNLEETHVCKGMIKNLDIPQFPVPLGTHIAVKYILPKNNSLLWQ
jgi:hypothetical protein